MKSEPRIREFSGGTFGIYKADADLADFLNTLREGTTRQKRAIQRKTAKMVQQMNLDYWILISANPVDYRRIYELLRNDWHARINAIKLPSYLKTKLFSCFRERFDQHMKTVEK